MARGIPTNSPAASASGIGIARALNPPSQKLIVADEPVSALYCLRRARRFSSCCRNSQREFAADLCIHLPQLARGGAGSHAPSPVPCAAGQFLEMGDAEQVLHQPRKRLHPQIADRRSPELPHA